MQLIETQAKTPEPTPQQLRGFIVESLATHVFNGHTATLGGEREQGLLAAIREGFVNPIDSLLHSGRLSAGEAESVKRVRNFDEQTANFILFATTQSTFSLEQIRTTIATRDAQRKLLATPIISALDQLIADAYAPVDGVSTGLMFHRPDVHRNGTLLPPSTMAIGSQNNAVALAMDRGEGAVPNGAVKVAFADIAHNNVGTVFINALRYETRHALSEAHGVEFAAARVVTTYDQEAQRAVHTLEVPFVRGDATIAVISPDGIIQRQITARDFPTDSLITPPVRQPLALHETAVILPHGMTEQVQRIFALGLPMEQTVMVLRQYQQSQGKTDAVGLLRNEDASLAVLQAREQEEARAFVAHVAEAISAYQTPTRLEALIHERVTTDEQIAESEITAMSPGDAMYELLHIAHKYQTQRGHIDQRRLVMLDTLLTYAQQRGYFLPRQMPNGDYEYFSMIRDQNGFTAAVDSPVRLAYVRVSSDAMSDGNNGDVAALVEDFFTDRGVQTLLFRDYQQGGFSFDFVEFGVNGGRIHAYKRRDSDHSEYVQPFLLRKGEVVLGKIALEGELSYAELRTRAEQASQMFLADAALVHDYAATLSITDAPSTDSSHYSIHGVHPEKGYDLLPQQLERAKIVLVSCMDKRVIAKLYQEVQRKYRVRPEEILVVSLAGGIIQTPEREAALLDILNFIGHAAPNVRRIIATGHTSDPANPESAVCGGVRHFVGESLQHAVIADQHDNLVRQHARHIRRASRRATKIQSQQEVEIAATAEMVSSHAHQVADRLRHLLHVRRLHVDALMVVPNEQESSVDIVTVGLSRQGLRLEQLASRSSQPVVN